MLSDGRAVTCGLNLTTENDLLLVIAMIVAVATWCVGMSLGLAEASRENRVGFATVRHDRWRLAVRLTATGAAMFAVAYVLGIGPHMLACLG